MVVAERWSKWRGLRKSDAKLQHSTPLLHYAFEVVNDILNKSIVLVLNRNWQAINVRTPQEAFCQMATNVATGLDIELGDDARAEALRPVSWDEWISLPIRAQDNFVRTARGAIRVPTV